MLGFARTRTLSTHCLPLALLLAATLAAGPTLAADDDDKDGAFIPANTAAKNFYGGVTLGNGDSDSPSSNQDGSVTGVTTDRRDVNSGVFVGYQITDNVAVQGGYRDLGQTDFRGVSDGSGDSWSAGPVRTLQEAEGWELGVMGRWPIAPRWYALGYVGVYWWENRETYTEGTFQSSYRASGSDATYALGFEFDHGLDERIVYRFMGSHHKVDDYNINSVSASVVYRFP